MKMIKSLILGSAAGLVAVGGAQAADLPVKAKAVEYVRVCSLYGAGFYFIPGTDTCIKLGGYLRADVSFNAAGAYDLPRFTGTAPSRNSNEYIFRSRQDINIDTRTATEYGVVRTYFDATFNWTTGSAGRAGMDDAALNGTGATGVGVYYAFIQFAGFTIGKAVSQYSTPWTGYPGNNTSFLVGGQDDVTGINQIAYTAQFGNGVSAAISLEDASGIYTSQTAFGVTNPLSYNSYNRGQLFGVLANNTLVPGWGGTMVPDIVGQLRIDQAWGLIQLSGVAHQIRPTYYAGSTINSPADTWGYAGMFAISLKNLPTGPGDTINFDASYSKGASRYVIGGVTGDTFGIFGNSNSTVALGQSSDGVYGAGNVELTEVYGVRGAFNHNWNPFWSSSLFGSYSAVRYNSNAKFLLSGTAVCGGLLNCNPDFDLSQIGMVTRWTPVKNLTFSGEIMYSYINQNMDGRVLANGLTLRNNGTFTGGLRAQRTF